ncbi:hypothetical protein B0H21DRAFT_825412 [Amylocystis lapponica]|nr:hypothetical protein B0H21DRAFT_825412 [Amylocystis lapponica]
MSYASVAAQNAPPPSKQPRADPALLNTDAPTADNIADDAAKVNLVAPDFREHPNTLTSEAAVPLDSDPTPSRKSRASARRYAQQAENESLYLWNLTKHYIFRPAVAGGLLGLVNVGLISSAGYTFYTNPSLRRDTKAMASALAATLTIGATESYLADQYLKTSAGQAEERKAKKEGAALYRHAREHLLRPGVLGGFVGILNAGILGTVGYFAYANWDRPQWDRRTVSVISVALFTLWSGEGFVAEQYRIKQH